jgi:hypothetical protein
MPHAQRIERGYGACQQSGRAVIGLRRRRYEQDVHTGSRKRNRAHQPGRTSADNGNFGSERGGHDAPAATFNMRYTQSQRMSVGFWLFLARNVS